MTVKALIHTGTLRRTALALLATSAFMLPLAAQAQLQKITYLLPAPGTLPAFGPWMLAQAKGYLAAQLATPPSSRGRRVFRSRLWPCWAAAP